MLSNFPVAANLHTEQVCKLDVVDPAVMLTGQMAILDRECLASSGSMSCLLGMKYDDFLELIFSFRSEFCVFMLNTLNFGYFSSFGSREDNDEMQEVALNWSIRCHVIVPYGISSQTKGLNLTFVKV